MTPEKRAEVKARILAAVEKVKGMGVDVGDGHDGIRRVGLRWERDESPRCCPIGALLLAEQPQSDRGPCQTAARALGATCPDIEEFARGVDGYDGYAGPWYDLGRELRAELLGDPL